MKLHSSFSGIALAGMSLFFIITDVSSERGVIPVNQKDNFSLSARKTDNMNKDSSKHDVVVTRVFDAPSSGNR